jgi:acetate kinase
MLVINSGSSSLKFSVLEVQSEAVLASGIAERLGTTEAVLKFGSINTKKIEERLSNADHRAALRRAIDHLRAVLPNEVDAVGHRIVHGGEYFRDAAILDDEVVNRIEEFTETRRARVGRNHRFVDREKRSSWRLWSESRHAVDSDGGYRR